MLDTLGLGAELDANSLITSQGEDEEPFVDFLTGYGVDGSVTAQGLWGFSGDSVVAERVGAILGQGMVGAKALATRSVRPYHVNVGIPAKSVRVKSIAPDEFRKDTTVERS